MHIKRLLTAAIVLTLSFRLVADEKDDVDPASLKRVDHDIKYLASDALEGRGVQTKGLTVAADYVRDEFKKAGLKGGAEDGSFFQYFDVPIREKADTQAKLTLTTGDKNSELKLGADYQPQQVGGPGKASGDVVFVGYGISAPDLGYDDYDGIDVKGKIVLMIRREPRQQDDDSKFDGKAASQHSYIATKLAAAKKAGAAGVLFVNDGLTAPSADKDALSPPGGFGTSRQGQRIPFVHITRAQGNSLLAGSPLKAGGKVIKTLADAEAHIDETMKPVSQALAGCAAEYSAEFRTKSVKAWNVIGVVEGEGPLAEEVVIVGAHYDHLGFGGYGSRRRGSTEVHNGADDNATGTAAVLELARRFAKADKKPARTMVFIGFSGEERGLVGSRYYVENPTVPLKNIAVMLNFDMIGNLRNNRATLGGAGSGTGLQAVAQAAADAVPVDVTIRAATSGGSDHLPFLGKRVPIMFCNTGLTDLYHTPEDDYETLNIPGAVKVVDFCEKLLQGVVDMEEKPTFTAAARPTRGRVRTYLGIQPAAPSADDEGKGILVRAVTAGSPAAKAGIKVGDRVLKVGTKEMKEIRDVFTVLIGKNPGDKMKVSLERDGAQQEVEVELSAPPARPRRGGANN